LAPLKDKLSAQRPVYLFGIDNENCDFRGTDIEEADGVTAFTVNYSGKSCKAEIPCAGRHNVLNALAAFCVGTIAGMSETEIVSALKKYQPDGMRQNIVKKGGVTVIIDCYNASPDSMKASLGVLAGMKTQGRKIAVLGDMLELGEASEKLHSLVGEYVHDTKPDMLFCYGKDSEFIAKKSGIDNEFSDNKQQLTESIRSYIKDGDVILFKASRGMKLEEVIDSLFDKEGE
ncbi:MAG: glutamate ligase domain-containing protein, partial [Porcipelethomonas sp.]